MISIVVPAHNEEAVIERSLRPLVEASRSCELEILVVCNGCTDATAERARSISGPIQVVESARASKTDALNLADELLSTFPRVYVDGDIELTASSLFALTRPLEAGECHLTLARSRYVVNGSTPVVRSYLRFWAMLPQVTSVAAGSGVYALSAEGRARFDRWPETANDDAYVRAQLADAVMIVDDAVTTVRAPRTVSALVRRKARVAYGNREAASGHRYGEVHPWLGWARALRKHPALLRDLPAYLYVTLLSRSRSAPWSRPEWAQDETTRTPGEPVGPTTGAGGPDPL